MPVTRKVVRYFKFFIRRINIYGKLAIRKAKRVSFVGFQGVPIYDVITLFANGIVKGSITTRASAVAFNFFVALFPTLIFFFTLIPYIPIDNFQLQLLNLIEEVLPITTFNMVEHTLVDVVTHRSWGLLSFGFIVAVFFAHNGINALIDAFNATYHSIEMRPFINQHLVAFMLTFLLPLLLTISVALVFFGQATLNFLVQKDMLQLNFTYYIIVVIRWVVIVMLIFFQFLFCTIWLLPGEQNFDLYLQDL